MHSLPKGCPGLASGLCSEHDKHNKTPIGGEKNDTGSENSSPIVCGEDVQVNYKSMSKSHGKWSFTFKITRVSVEYNFHNL